MTDKDFSNVDLPEGFSGSELKLSTWWAYNSEKVRSYAIGAFIIFDVALLLFGLWGFFDWLVFNGVREERDIRRLTSVEYVQLGVAPAIREVKFGSPVVLALPDSRYDVLIPVDNENPNHWLELGYRIVIGGEETDLKKTYVLPGESKFIAELAIARPGSPGSVELKVETRKWHLVDAHMVEDYPTYAESRLRFGVSEPTFTPPEAGNVGGVTKFTLTNDTAFTYHDVDVLVLLYRGASLVGVNKIRINRLETLEKRNMEIFWFQPLPQVTRTDVMINVNILDEDSIEIPR